MALKHFLRTFQKSFSLLSFVLFIYFPTIWLSGGGTEQVARAGKRYLTIVLVQATITATRFAIEKRPRLRLIRRSRGFDQYTDQYQKISGWTQWTRQLFVPTENGAKSAGKHPIAGLLRPDASSHAGGHWFESSSLHQKEPDFIWNQVLFFLFAVKKFALNFYFFSAQYIDQYRDSSR